MQAKIIRSTGSWYDALAETDQIYKCRVKGKLKINKTPTTNPIAVGDIVQIELEPENSQTADNQPLAVITAVNVRRNYVIRQSTHNRRQMHLIASNIDQAILVTTLRSPNIKFGFIDRFLLTTATYQIPTVLVFNKADLYDADDLDFYAEVKDIYTKIGYTCLLVSAQTGEGIEELKNMLQDKTSMVGGHSGVGKSSLLNSIAPQLHLRTQEVSDTTDKGMHTTTFAEMFRLNTNTFIIDTPGIKELGFVNLSAQDISHNFLEIFAESQHCKYANCMHIDEPNCAVKKAVETEKISSLRYQNYLMILDSIEDQNHWEQQMDW